MEPAAAPGTAMSSIPADDKDLGNGFCDPSEILSGITPGDDIALIPFFRAMEACPRDLNMRIEVPYHIRHSFKHCKGTENTYGPIKMLVHRIKMLVLRILQICKTKHAIKKLKAERSLEIRALPLAIQSPEEVKEDMCYKHGLEINSRLANFTLRLCAITRHIATKEDYSAISSRVHEYLDGYPSYHYDDLKKMLLLLLGFEEDSEKTSFFDAFIESKNQELKESATKFKEFSEKLAKETNIDRLSQIMASDNPIPEPVNIITAFLSFEKPFRTALLRQQDLYVETKKQLDNIGNSLHSQLVKMAALMQERTASRDNTYAVRPSSSFC